MANEKEKLPKDDVIYDSNGSHDQDFEAAAPPSSGGLARNLQGRHMQMIAIGTFTSDAPLKPIQAVGSVREKCARKLS